MAAAKFLDAISRMPGMAGENADARGAYTQVTQAEVKELLGDHPGCNAETWVRLPSNRRPKSWDKIDHPVCKLLINLYGHPLAVLIWEKYCHKRLAEIGFEKIHGWENLFVHREKKLFLSVYVDDFKMAGSKQHLKAMWEEVGKKLEMDPPEPVHGNVYLGCSQHDIKTDNDLVNENRNL